LNCHQIHKHHSVHVSVIYVTLSLWFPEAIQSGTSANKLDVTNTCYLMIYTILHTHIHSYPVGTFSITCTHLVLRVHI